MKVAYCLLISLAIFCSCKKSNGVGPTPPNGNVTVYVSGNCWDSLAARWVPVYWEDATVHYLSGSNGENSYARAIVWSNNGLLIAGQARDWLPAGGLWVNGISKDLGLKDTAALSDIIGMYVTGNDIYLAGSGVNSGADYGPSYSYAKIWKNGTITSLNSSPGYARAEGVTVVGQDVYVAWTESKKNGYDMAVYNKNQNRFVLDSLSPEVKCQAICSSGSDVYIAGVMYDSVSKKNQAVYWKNGAPIKIQATNEINTYASGIVAAGNDVYISGEASSSNADYAVYWKNGTEHRITDGSFPAVAYAIALSGADIYTAGMENFIPMYWKNDVPHKLPMDNTHNSYSVTGIVVVQK
jgi:hypothetical protein